MKRQEATAALNDGGEHKFLIRGESPAYVKAVAREKEIAPRLHEELIRDFIASGVFLDDNGVIAGYCKVEGTEGRSRLLCWGESSYPTKAATNAQFYSAVDKHGVILF